MSADTNVYKFFALLPGDSQTRSTTTRTRTVPGQVAFYDDGVGADGLSVQGLPGSCDPLGTVRSLYNQSGQ